MDATYKSLSRSIGRSVGPSIRQLVCRFFFGISRVGKFVFEHAPSQIMTAPAQIITARAQIITALALIITAPAQPPTTRRRRDGSSRVYGHVNILQL